MPSKVPVPFSDPPYLMGLPSAYYNDSHRHFQQTVRAFVDEHMMEDAGAWEQDGDVPGLSQLLRCDEDILGHC